MSAAKRPRVTIYRAGDGWRWRLRAKNGRIQAVSSEAYVSKYNATRALFQVMYMFCGTPRVASPRVEVIDG